MNRGRDYYARFLGLPTEGKVLERDACITQARAAFAKATGGAA